MGTLFLVSAGAVLTTMLEEWAAQLVRGWIFQRDGVGDLSWPCDPTGMIAIYDWC